MAIFDYVLTNYRWIFICFYLLPASAFYNICSLLKNWLIFQLYSSPKYHDNKIKNIQKQIHQWIKSGQQTQICTSRTGVQSLNAKGSKGKNNLYNVKVNLHDILEINKERQTVKLEPQVTIGRLTSTLLPMGLTLPVVPGIEDFTVGGLVMGAGLDSSSHKYGLFHNTCVSYELVLSDGSLVKCSKNDNPDLFFAVPWSYGTLGILTAIEIQLVPAHNFVRLKFEAYHNELLSLEKFLKECKNKENDFVEGFMYTENQCVVVTGTMVDEIEPNKLNEIGKWYKPWFFQHVKSYFTKGKGIEYIPLNDYYYRHTRSTYWELQNIIPFGNNILFRLFLGWTVPPKLSFLKLTDPELIKKLYNDELLMLDLMIPADKLQVSLDTCEKKLGVYPIWLCSFKMSNNPGFVHSINALEDLYINMGVYGVPRSKEFCPQSTLKEVEKFVREMNGFRMLYGDIHMNEDEFRQQFDHTLYDQVRNKLNCQKAFPTIFDKVNRMSNENLYNKKFTDCL